MFCSNCGNQLPENASFCKECGAKVNSEEDVVGNFNREKLKKAPLVRKVGAVIVIILVIALCSMIHKPGREVRDGYLDYYSDSITVEDAFASFFENGKWSEHKENGDTYIIYTGDCWYMDERVNVKIRFRVDDDCFYFANMEMNGQPQSDIISEALFDKVYESYY